MTAERLESNGETKVLAIQLCNNGPGIGEAVDTLVRDAART